MKTSLSAAAAFFALAACIAAPASPPPVTVEAGGFEDDRAAAFRSMDQAVPVAVVDRGDGPVQALPARPEDLSGVAYQDTSGAASTLAGYLDRYAVDAMVIVQEGEIVLERYDNGQSPEDRHIVYSVTKSFTALLAELLIADGVVDENAPISDYVAELAGSAYGDATLRQALDMQVGADFTEIYDDPDSSITQFAYAAGLLARPDGATGPDSLHAYLPTIAKKGEHGGPFHYNTATTEVVGWVVERASGKRVSDLLSDRIYARIGAERDAYFLAADTNATPMAGGGLNISARDLARLGLLVLSNGVSPSGEQLIPSAALEAIRQADLSLGDWVTPGGTSTYRSFWYVNPQDGVLVANGIHGQILYVSPRGGLVAVAQSSNETAEGPFFTDAERLFDAVAARYAD